MSLDPTLLSIVGRMPFTGSPGDQVDFYSQTRKNNAVFTKTGCDFTSAQSKFGTSSLSFSGSGSKLAANAGFSIGETLLTNPAALNYTITCWVRASGGITARQCIFAEDVNHGVFILNSTISYRNIGGDLISSTAISANQWYHVALCKSGSTMSLYINGVAVNAGITRNVVFPVYFLGGSGPTATDGLTGFINDFKYENIALYSGNFTPPTAAMNLDLYDYKSEVVGRPVKIPSYIAPSTVSKTIKSNFLLQKTYHMGPGRILGTVKEAHLPTDTPLARRVRLHRKSDGMLIEETWSNAAGNYAFTNIAIQKYYVVAFDHTDTYNAVIKDSITPEI